MIKIALCISGHIRTLQNNIKYLKQHLLDNKELQVDIFIHTWSNINSHIINNNYTLIENIILLCNPKDL